MTTSKPKVILNQKQLVFAILILNLFFVCGIIFALNSRKQRSVRVPINSALKIYSVTDLQPFNGTDSNKPIYIGLNGLVYDVSSGHDYYQTGGPYHDLVGRDSSKELNLIGGTIIMRKYPVVGVLQ